MYELEETIKASEAVKATLAPPLLLNHDPLTGVSLTLIGISVNTLLSGVITPDFKAPIIIAGLTTDPIVID